MANANGTNTSMSNSFQESYGEITNECNGYYLTDMDKILLEIVCEKLMDDLDAFLKWMGSHQLNSPNLANNDHKKELLKCLIFSNEQNSVMQLNQMENQIVRVPFKLSLKNLSQSFKNSFDFRTTYL